MVKSCPSGLLTTSPKQCSVDNAEEYHRRAYFLSFLDTCILQLKERFTDHSAKTCKISAVISGFMDGCSVSDLEPVVELFSYVLSRDSTALKVEYKRW